MGEEISPNLQAFCKGESEKAAGVFWRSCQNFALHHPELNQSGFANEACQAFLQSFSVYFEKSSGFPIQRHQPDDESFRVASPGMGRANGEDKHFKRGFSRRFTDLFRSKPQRGSRNDSGEFSRGPPITKSKRWKKKKHVNVTVDTPAWYEEKPGKWLKCRIVLVYADKNPPTINIFSPPKSLKPAFEMLVSDIEEVKHSSDGGEGSSSNKITLKDKKEGKSLNFSLTSHNEKESWVTSLANFCYNIVQDGAEQGSEGERDSPIAGESSHNKHPPQQQPQQQQPHQQSRPLPPTAQADVIVPPPVSSSFAGQELHQYARTPDEITLELQEFPWFHYHLSRIDAAAYVQVMGAESHGTFLIRQSETRDGESVLTFNYRGKAKHLRITIQCDGHCKVQHLTFDSVLDMMEHFHDNPIPLDAGGALDPAHHQDIKLADYVMSPVNHGAVRIYEGSVRHRLDEVNEDFVKTFNTQ